MDATSSIISCLSVTLTGVLGWIGQRAHRRIDELERSQNKDQIHFATVVEKLSGLAVQVEKGQERMEDHHAENTKRLEDAASEATHWRHNVLGPILRSLETDTTAIKAEQLNVRQRLDAAERRRR